LTKYVIHVGNSGRPVNRSLLSVVPNGLSAARVVLGVAFPFVPPEWRVWVVVAAALSDMFDGLVARWLRVESDTGRLLDPVADKLFVLMLAGTLLVEGALHPLWAVGLAARDLTVSVGLLYVIVRRQWARGRQLRPSWLGKCATAGQFAVLLVLVVWAPAPVWLLAAVTLLSAVAAVDYARRFLTAPTDEAAATSSGAPGA
jgi:cardiolipin synthase (CMP-forming)